MAGADQTQENTLSHTSGAFPSDKVELLQNQVQPQNKSPVIAFIGPDEFEDTEYVARRHHTNFVPRTVEEHTADNTGSIDLSARIQPVAGERELDRQDYPAVVLVNVDQGSEVEITDVDYAAGTISFSAQPNDETLKAFPIITEGTAQFQGVNQFDQVEGPADRWETPLYRWHDMKQDKRGTRVNLQGRISFSRSERLEFVVDSPHEVVWEDPDYPEAFVSKFEQKVEITL